MQQNDANKYYCQEYQGSHKQISISDSPDAHTIHLLRCLTITYLNVISQVQKWDNYFGDFTDLSKMKRDNSKSIFYIPLGM